MKMQIASKTITLAGMRLVTFRPATTDDYWFLLDVYASTRMEELAVTDWDKAQRAAFLKMQFDAQLSHYREHYPEGEHLIIYLDSAAAGRLYVANIAEEIRILDITLLTQNRNLGIGTPIIKGLMAEAAGMGKPLRIWLESYNPSLRLFEKLGFVKSSESGYSYLMEWRSA
jgi:GNAT superfamily N-acetyltransferase